MQIFLIVVLIVTALLGAGMLLADSKGFKFQLPDLAALKRLLPQGGDADDDVADYETEELDAFNSARNVLKLPPRPSGAQEEAFEPFEDADVQLPSPELFDLHEPNRDREGLDDPDPELEAVVASIGDEQDDMPEAEIAEDTQDTAVRSETSAGEDDIMSFFEPAAEISRRPQALAEDIADVSAAELLAEARQLRSLLNGRR